MTTTVLLDRFWLVDAVDPTDVCSFAYAGDSYDVTPALGGGVESDYPSGRSRSWSTAEDTTAVTLALDWLSDDDRKWLVAHRGRPVCFLDLLGLKVFVQYRSTPFKMSTAAPESAYHSCELALSSATWSEAV